MNQIPDFYCPPFQTPLYWGDEQSGELPNAVRHYFDHILGQSLRLETAADLDISPLTERELQLLCDFCRYFINAPCWENNLAGRWPAIAAGCPEMLAVLQGLKESAKTLASVADLRRWNAECMEIGLDPF